MLNVKVIVAKEPCKVSLETVQIDEAALPPDQVLVKTEYSAVSAGTECAWISGNSNNPGWFKGKTYHPPLTREQLMDAVRRVKRFVLSHPMTCEAKTCLWYAWNEFDEGGWLCPTRGIDGKPDTMRIEAIKAALTE